MVVHQEALYRFKSCGIVHGTLREDHNPSSKDHSNWRKVSSKSHEQRALTVSYGSL